jgi:hypothetical protein
MNPPGWNVYVMECERGGKIGISRNLPGRLLQLGYETAKAKRVVRSWHRPDDAKDVEATALALMGATETLYNSEHFDAPPEKLIRKVEEAIGLVDAGRGLLSFRRNR